MRTSDRTAQLIAEVERFGAHNYHPLPVVLTRGERCFVWDVDGRRYFDFLSAYSAVNQGHCHPRIVAALVEQASRLTITSRAFHNDLLGSLLKRLTELTGYEMALPMNTGAEAVETAIKAMRRWGYEKKGLPDGTGEILVASGNFHGRTTTIVGMSDDPSSFEHYGPFTPGFQLLPYGDAAAFERAMNERTVGVLLEPVQGEAGVVIPPDDFLRGVREACTRHGALLAIDEIQTGLGRTGKMFAWEHSGARPDLLVVGKSLAGGVYPVSAMCADRAVMEVFTPGTHGSTYGGNPLACAAALAGIAVTVEERLPERSAELGAWAVARLREEIGPLPKVKEVRGRGLMIAIEFREGIARSVAHALADAGVLCKDTHATTIRILPPLVITREELDEALGFIVAAVRAI